MSIYVQTNDFENGQTKIPLDKYTIVDLQLYLDKYEVIILQDLLGCAMYDDFANDWDANTGEPTSNKFKDIWNPFCIDDSLCVQRRSLGIKEMLKLMLYFYYVRDIKTSNNIGGVNKNVQANSNEASFKESNIFTNYNEAIRTYWSIQWYIDCENPNNHDYSNYEGIFRDKISLV